VLNIGLFTSENKPLGLIVRTADGAGFDTWTTPFTRAASRVQRIPAFILATGGAVTGLPRRLWDHLFAGSDTEASWHGWQVIREDGGLSRRYRDPAFDTLAACRHCQGSGREHILGG
jgi:hypothetical protein